MKKIRRVLLIGVTPVCILGIAAGEALAMDGNTSGNCSNSTVQPYTGGAPVSKVFYPADGSTVTITKTGAVIKQSPCGTPYREGWVNPNNISGINVYSNIPQLKPGAANPYVTTSKTTTSQSQNNSSSSSSKATASANATVNVSSTPVVAAASTTSAHQSGTSSAAASAAANTAATLPNTGPGNVLALGAITTAVGAIGHFLYKTRLRLLS